VLHVTQGLGVVGVFEKRSPGTAGAALLNYKIRKNACDDCLAQIKDVILLKLQDHAPNNAKSNVSGSLLIFFVLPV